MCKTKIMERSLANLKIFSSHIFNVHSVHNYKQLFIVSQLNSDINKGSVIINIIILRCLLTPIPYIPSNTTEIPELARKFLGILIKLEIQNSKFKLNSI